MNNKILKMALFTDEGKCKKKDVNHLISALIRLGYKVILHHHSSYLEIQLGNDDIVEE